MTKLSIEKDLEHAERFCHPDAHGDTGLAGRLAKQLADCMRENEMLREALKFYAEQSNCSEYPTGCDDGFDYGLKAKEAISSSKHGKENE